LPFHLLGVASRGDRQVSPDEPLTLSNLELDSPWPVAELLAERDTLLRGVWHSAQLDVVQYLVVEGMIQHDVAAEAITEAGLVLADFRRLILIGAQGVDVDDAIRSRLQAIRQRGDVRRRGHLCAECGGCSRLHFSPPH